MTRTIIFVTRSLDYACIANRTVDSSSKSFEYDLTRALSSKADVHIIHLGRENKATIELMDGSKFTTINYHSILGVARLLVALLRTAAKHHDAAVITTGYYLFEMIAVYVASRLNHIKAFGYVYDTHKSALAKMPFLKKLIANVYFEIGFFFVKKSAGLLVLNDEFIRKNGIRTPHLKTRIGVGSHIIAQNSVSASEIQERRARSPTRRVLAFAGTMNRANGVEIILDYLRANLRQEKVEFHFYGDGDCASAVIAQAATDDRVRYFGRISEILLLEKLRSADYLINLRDPGELCVDYSFPSKLISFMATGVPVISNRFPGLDEIFGEHLMLIDYSVEALAGKISCLEITDSARLGLDARKFILAANDWSAIVDELLDFIKCRARC